MTLGFLSVHLFNEISMKIRTTYTVFTPNHFCKEDKSFSAFDTSYFSEGLPWSIMCS